MNNDPRQLELFDDGPGKLERAIRAPARNEGPGKLERAILEAARRPVDDDSTGRWWSPSTSTT
jgi:hypothetical protein